MTAAIKVTVVTRPGKPEPINLVTLDRILDEIDDLLARRPELLNLKATP